MVDDSVVVRRMVSDVLSSDPELEIAGAAANGKIALAKIPQVNPDIIILDVEMPELDGLATLEKIRQSKLTTPVIMYSTLTERGAAATLEALSKGATDYVTKPSNVGSAAQGLERIRTQLIPKIKAICGRAAGITQSGQSVAPAAPPVHRNSQELSADRYCYHRGFHRRPQRARGSHPIAPEGLTCSSGHCPAHASRFYAATG